MGITELPRRAPREAGRGAGFRTDVEGLRAVAIGLVLLFNAGVPLAGGGRVGVDVFFVISGFLITGLLVRELESTGRIGLAAFYARRARRILPAAAVVVVATVAATAVLVPARAADTARDGIAAALQVANWWLLSFGTAELAADVSHSPLKHYWSLAVEEQFYLLWPVLVVVLTAWHARRGAAAGNLRRRLAVGLGVVTVLSFAASVVVSSQAELLGYLSSPTRAWQFGVGGLLALAVPLLDRAAGDRRAALALQVAGPVGLLAVISCLPWVGSVVYPGAAALVPTLGTAAVIAAGCSGRAGSGIGWLLSLPPVRFLGRLSYTWYLWHVPAVFFAAELAGVDGWPSVLAVELAAAVPAVLTMWLVEGPVRRTRLVAGTPGGLVLGGATTAVALAVCGAVLI